MAPGRFIGEEVAKLDDQLFHNLRDRSNRCHTGLPHPGESMLMRAILHALLPQRKFAKTEDGHARDRGTWAAIKPITRSAFTTSCARTGLVW